MFAARFLRERTSQVRRPRLGGMSLVRVPTLPEREGGQAADRRSDSGVSSRAAPRLIFRNGVAAARARAGWTLVELLVVLAIGAILTSLLVAAVVRVHEAAQRMHCAQHLQQIGIALAAYHDGQGRFPHAYDARALFRDPSHTPAQDQLIVTKSWASLLLPYLEQENLDRAGYAVAHGRQVPLYTCPSDRRATALYPGDARYDTQGLTAYLAVTGTMTFNGDPDALPSRRPCDGVLYESSRTRLADISDGTSTTLLVGERPPTADLYWGWWTWGAFDSALGVRNSYPVYGTSGDQPPIICLRFLPENYRPNDTGKCDTHHFWSAHPGGGNWLFADGSVRFLPYRANAILPALATRNGGEAVLDPD